jgi:hypothetical protein
MNGNLQKLSKMLKFLGVHHGFWQQRKQVGFVLSPDLRKSIYYCSLWRWLFTSTHCNSGREFGAIFMSINPTQNNNINKFVFSTVIGGRYLHIVVVNEQPSRAHLWWMNLLVVCYCCQQRRPKECHPSRSMLFVEAEEVGEKE